MFKPNRIPKHNLAHIVVGSSVLADLLNQCSLRINVPKYGPFTPDGSGEFTSIKDLTDNIPSVAIFSPTWGEDHE